MKSAILLVGLVSSLVAFAPLRCLAGAHGKQGPHGGVLVGDENHEVELSIDQGRSTVDVYVIRGQNQFPDSLGLSLLDSSGNKRLLELRATQSPSQALPLQYHGQLEPGQQSYVGFELKIPFALEPAAIFKSNRED